MVSAKAKIPMISRSSAAINAVFPETSSSTNLVSILSVFATLVQFFGYGYGFILSTIYIGLFNREPEKVFPFLFFNVK